MESSDGSGALSGPKERTMRLLREAARELLRTGRPLTVPAAAELAGVSRATAYRYFPNNDAVVLHATMSLADDPLDGHDWASPRRHRPASLAPGPPTWCERPQRGPSTTRPSYARCSASRSTPEREHSETPARTDQPWPLDRRPARRPAQRCPSTAPAIALRTRLSRCSDPMPSSGRPIWPSYLASRPSTSSRGWRKFLSRPRWQAGNSPSDEACVTIA